MLQSNLVVAACARLGTHSSLTMRLVTREARLISVDGHGWVISLRCVMAAQAVSWSLEVASCPAHVLPQGGGLRRCKLMTREALFCFASGRVVRG